MSLPRLGTKEIGDNLGWWPGFEVRKKRKQSSEKDELEIINI